MTKPNTTKENDFLDKLKGYMNLVDLAPNEEVSSCIYKMAVDDLIPAELKNRSAEDVRKAMVNSLIKELDALIIGSAYHLEQSATHYHKLYQRDMTYAAPVMAHFNEKGYTTSCVETLVQGHSKDNIGVLEKVILVKW